MKIIQKANGYTNVTHATDRWDVKVALYALEDGLSYLGYALDAGDNGLQDPQQDLDVAIGFLAKALEVLNCVKL